MGAFANLRKVITYVADPDPYGSRNAEAFAQLDGRTLKGQESRKAVRFGYGAETQNFWDLPPLQHWPGGGGSDTVRMIKPHLAAPSGPGGMQDLLGEFGL